ncbi:hypothetical protein TNCV_4359301 [Trichonephila clavipes]|uniref:Uncharacterized protein n=1 Tax=Trichonephila clavipes TaxID=2585209 RepID=A0A8X7BH68_TRICX|nr:hypothetical protein TNCV_4359301 [Trichonephila clavipes]
MERDPLKVDVSIPCYGSEIIDYSNDHEVIHLSPVLQVLNGASAIWHHLEYHLWPREQAVLGHVRCFVSMGQNSRQASTGLTQGLRDVCSNDVMYNEFQ